MAIDVICFDGFIADRTTDHSCECDNFITPVSSIFIWVDFGVNGNAWRGDRVGGGSLAL